MAAPANVCRSSASCARRCTTPWRSWAREGRSCSTSSSTRRGHRYIKWRPDLDNRCLSASCTPESEVPPQDAIQLWVTDDGVNCSSRNIELFAERLIPHFAPHGVDETGVELLKKYRTSTPPVKRAKYSACQSFSEHHTSWGVRSTLRPTRCASLRRPQERSRTPHYGRLFPGTDGNWLTVA